MLHDDNKGDVVIKEVTDQLREIYKNVVNEMTTDEAAIKLGNEEYACRCSKKIIGIGTIETTMIINPDMY